MLFLYCLFFGESERKKPKILEGTNRKRSDWPCLYMRSIRYCERRLRATWDEQPVHFEMTMNRHFEQEEERAKKFSCVAGC